MRVVCYGLRDPEYPDVWRYVGTTWKPDYRKRHHAAANGMALCNVWEKALKQFGRRVQFETLEEFEIADPRTPEGRREIARVELRLVESLSSHPLLNLSSMLARAAALGVSREVVLEYRRVADCAVKFGERGHVDLIRLREHEFPELFNTFSLGNLWPKEKPQSGPKRKTA